MPPRSSAKSSRGFLTPVQSLSGRYELLGRLGSGGMAEVYLARAVGLEDFEFEKIVVLKRVLPERMDDPRYMAMFRDEARVAATLEHPNIVHTHDIGLKDDECFFTMEYLHGEDLKAILIAAHKQQEKLPLELALQIAVGCTAGLHYAHEQTDYAGRPLEIVHRDVSPSNVIVTRQSGVKLIDFGIAKATSDKEQTAVGVLKGKVAYMSPEQCRGEPLDRRSDIFAMGIVLYEMVTMERPYKAGTVLGTVHKLLGEEPPPPRQLRPDCPRQLERIIIKALHKDANERYQTAFEMQEELELVTRDHQLHGLPGALGRYLEHLFGPKPHPWRERAKQPPAVPRWAWAELDSTVTTPREDAAKPMPALPTPGSLQPLPKERRNTVPSPQAAVANAHPSGAFPPLPQPAPQPTGSYVPIAFENTYASELAPGFGQEPGPELAPGPILPPSSSTHGDAPRGVPLKYLLIGSLVGGSVALGGLRLWNLANEPTHSDASPSLTQGPTDASVTGASVTRPSLAMATPATSPAASPAAATGGEEPETSSGGHDDELLVEEPEPDANPADEPARLLARAREALPRDARQAYRDAKAAYDLEPSQDALEIMGEAACRLRQEPRARYAYTRLRGNAKTELRRKCKHEGVSLD
ncbi:serine/threonine protein kinase [Paraliomyxa miuraensis]|uniref:serine/threonine protein kinase n=1 Tax=Paraliomyxa miuraensis TaxID=376150 RepID=UPI002258F694|nr:serine/threonine-protein kinase [Paraliomyxa miuraensis]MCX4240929.1 serine/threonine protein kinase [Paraliomyxa miuraensis]